MAKPPATSYPGYFQKYIDLVTEEDLMTAFKKQLPGIQSLLASVPEDKGTYAYAVGKWTLKELLQHIIDAERIFAYRALCFARGEEQSLPGFEENDYAANSNADNRTWQSLVEEYLAVRHCTELLFKSFSKKALASIGTANNNKQSVESTGFIILGHTQHHMNVMKERYL